MRHMECLGQQHAERKNQTRFQTNTPGILESTTFGTNTCWKRFNVEALQRLEYRFALKNEALPATSWRSEALRLLMAAHPSIQAMWAVRALLSLQVAMCSGGHDRAEPQNALPLECITKRTSTRRSCLFFQVNASASTGDSSACEDVMEGEPGLNGRDGNTVSRSPAFEKGYNSLWEQ